MSTDVAPSDSSTSTPAPTPSPVGSSVSAELVLPIDRRRASRSEGRRLRSFARFALTVSAVAAVACFGHFAARRSAVVLVKPYVQPGNGAELGESDVKVICWLTDPTPADFTVDYWPRPGTMRSVKPEAVPLEFRLPGGGVGNALAPSVKSSGPTTATSPSMSAGSAKSAGASGSKRVDDKRSQQNPEARDQFYRKYAAQLVDLPLDAEVKYRVRLGDVVVREATFRTRASPDRPTRLVLVGDMATGQAAQNAVAFRISEARPDFLIALGDIVYSTGRVSQYMRHFWPTYNDVERPSVKTGAPLMATVPFYAVLGNHDIGDKLPNTTDAYGAFYFFHPPQRGPGEGPWNTPLGNDEQVARRFRSLTTHSYPYLDAYSFDSGPAHFVVLNNDRRIDAGKAALRAWVERDLTESKARWKFVCMHAPAFHTSTQHESEQQMRLWHPMFEATGVSIVFAGHVHNYQRSHPLRFVPDKPDSEKSGRVDGRLTLDDSFDGERNTRPNGVIHIVAGGGGAGLHQPPSANPAPNKPAPADSKPAADASNPAPEVDGPAEAEVPAGKVFRIQPFTAKHVADRHSFVLLEVAAERLTVSAIDSDGREVDRFVVTSTATAAGK